MKTPPNNALEESEELRRRSLEWFADYQETGRVLQRDLHVAAILAETADEKPPQ